MSDSYQWIWLVLGVLVLHFFCTRLAAAPPPPKYGPKGPPRGMHGTNARDAGNIPAEDDWGVTSEFGLGGPDARR